MPTRAAPTSGGASPQPQPREDDRAPERRHGYVDSTYARPVDTSSPVQGQDRIGVVEKAAGGTIPSMVHLAISQMNASEQEIMRAARLAARVYDTTPQALFGKRKLSQLEDPITGGPLRASSLRRLTNGLEPLTIYQMLEGATQSYNQSSAAGRRKFGGKVSVQGIAALFEIIGREFSDEDLTAQDGLGAAISIAEDGVKPKLLEQNIQAVKRWAATGIDANYQTQLGIAIEASKVNERLDSPASVVAFTHPELSVPGEAEMENLKAQGMTEQQIKQSINYAHRRRAALAAGKREPNLPQELEGLPVSWAHVVAAAPNAAKIPLLAEWQGSYDSSIQRAKDLKDEVVLQEEAWQNSWLNRKIVSPFLTGLDYLNRAFEVEGLVAFTGLEQSPQFGVPIQLAKLATTKDPSLAFRPPDEAGEQLLEDIKGAALGKFRIADMLQRDWGVQSWQSEIIEFTVGWYLDPMILGGKALSKLSTRRFHPQLLAKLTHGEASEKSMTKYFAIADDFAKTNAADFARAALDSDEAVTRWTRKFKSFSGETPLSDPYFQRVREEAVARGLTVNDVDEFEAALRVPSNMEAPEPGSLADFSWRSRLAEQEEAVRLFNENPLDPARHADLAEKQAAVWISDAYDPTVIGGKRLEVPGVNKPLPGFGMVKTFGNKYGDILGDTQIGATLRSLPTIDPGSVLKIHEDPGRWFRLNARRAGLPESEVLSWESKASKAVGSNVPEQVKTVLNDFEESAMFKFSRRTGMKDATARTLLDDLAAGGGWKRSERVFGVHNDLRFLDDGTPYVGANKVKGIQLVPEGQSQLVNELPAIDPILMRRAVEEYVGTVRLFRASLLKSIGKELPEINRKAVLSLPKMLDALVLPFGRAVLKTFKFSAVARPAYIFRVVLGDELMRSLATTQSVWEQALGYGLGTKAILQAPDPNILQKVLGPVAKKIDSLGHRRVNGYELPRAGGRPKEPLANTYLDYADLTSDTMAITRRRHQALELSGDWGIVYPDNPTVHLPAWEHALNKQVKHSPAMSEAAAMMFRDGVKDLPALKLRMREWVKSPSGRTELQRIGKRSFESDHWADDVSELVWGYTLGDPNLARAAYLGAVDRRMLEQYPDVIWRKGGKTVTENTPGAVKLYGRPVIHGPKLAKVKGSAGHRFTQRWYGATVRGPENILNRQVFYHNWQTRAEGAYLKMLPNESLTRRPPARVFKPDTVSLTPTAELVGDAVSASARKGYMFHVTSPRALDNVAAEGLKPTVARLDHAAEIAEGDKLFFSSSPKAASAQAVGSRGATSGQVLLRVKDGSVTDALTVSKNESFVQRAVPPSEIEFMAEDGTWHRLTTDGQAQMKTAVEGMARRFALAHNKRIMFDFTENTRLGEMVSFAAPFMQPFLENIAVWGHILTRRNPALIGYVNRLAQAGVNSGFIRKDPDTGEWVIPETWWMFGAPVLWMIGGRDKGGQLSHGYSLSSRLTSLNLFASSTFPVEGIPIPAPGMSPWVQWPLAKFIDDKKVPYGLEQYVMQFGPGADTVGDAALEAFVPRYLRLALASWKPDVFAKDKYESLAIDYLRLQQYLGQEVNPDQAYAQARMTLGYLAMGAAFFPGAFSIKYPHTFLEEEYHDQIDAAGGDVTKARDYMLEKFPEYSLITIPKTAAARVSNWMTPEGEEMLNLFGEVNEAPPGIRPASTRYFEKIIEEPGFKEFANDPETAMWAMVFVMNAGNPKADIFDLAAYTAEVSRGDTRQRTALEVYADFQEFEFNERWRPIEADYDQQFAQLEKDGLDDNDPKWTSLADDKAIELERIATGFDVVDSEMLQPRENGPGYQFSFESEGRWPEGVHPAILHSARLVLESDVAKDFPAVKGLREYWDIRTDIKEELQAKGLRGLESIGAEKIRGDYWFRTQGVLAEHPEFEKFYETWFDHDLAIGLPTKGEEIIRQWKAEATPKNGEGRTSQQVEAQRRYEAYLDFTTKMDVYSTKAQKSRAEDLEIETSAVYTERTRFINNVYKANPEFLDVFLKQMTAGERRQFTDPIYVRPPEFYSRLDWKLMGVNVTDRAAGWLEQMQAEGLEIGRFEEKYDTIRSTGPRHEALSGWIHARMGKDKSFDKALEAMATWGWGAIAKGYTQQGGRTGEAWHALLAYANSIRLDGEDAKIHGDDSRVEFDPDNRAWWNNQRDTLKEYRDTLAGWDKSGAFDKQWADMASSYDGNFLYWLMPHVHYKIGQVDAY